MYLLLLRIITLSWVCKHEMFIDDFMNDSRQRIIFDMGDILLIKKSIGDSK